MSKIDQLLDKIGPAWTEFINGLKELGPVDIMAHSYELVIKSDIIETLQEMRDDDGWDGYFSGGALDMLLEMDDPLDAMFEAWYSVEEDRTELYREAVQRAGTGNYRKIFVQKGEKDG